MSDALKALRAEFASATTAAQKALQDGDHDAAATHVASAEALKAKIENAQQTANALAGLKAWDASPAGVLPSPHMKQVGVATINTDGGGTEIEQFGAGVLTDAQVKAITDSDYKAAFKAFIRAKGDMNGVKSASYRKLLEVGIDEDGGALAPAEMVMQLVERKATPTSVAQYVTTFNTARDRLILPKQNYAADDIYSTGVRVTWTGEGGSPTAQNVAFGTIQIPVHEAMLEVDLTNTMIEDAGLDIQGYVSGKFRETVDILEDNMILNGTGIHQPTGVLANVDGTNGVVSVASGNSSALTADGLIGLAYSVPEQYLDACRFFLNRTNTEKAIAKLKDSSNRYLFAAAGAGRDGIATARPSDLLGFPLIRSGLMPNVAANAYPVIYGDLRGHYLVRRLGLNIRVLTELEARANKVVLLGRLRFGGDVAEPWRMRAQKVAS